MVVAVRTFPARSVNEPPLRSGDEATTIPSVSYSPLAVPTLYLNSAVLESDIDTYVAYLVSDPTVNVSLGEPETVTDSEKLTVKVGVSAGI